MSSSFLWFCFCFLSSLKSGGGLVGVVALCDGVGLVGGGSKTTRVKGLGRGCVSTGGDEKRDLLSSFAPCTLDTQVHFHKHTKSMHIMTNNVMLVMVVSVSTRVEQVLS